MSKKKNKHKPPADAFVFAYGSNMNRRQMAFRCPSARVVTVARLSDHRLAFAGYNSRWGGGVATVVPARRSNVLGVVWRLSTADLQRLDEFEGFPFVYDRTAVVVHDQRGGQFWCHTYVKNAVGLEMAPSEEYLRTILDGYHGAGARVPVALKRLYAETLGATPAPPPPVIRAAYQTSFRLTVTRGAHGLAA